MGMQLRFAIKKKRELIPLFTVAALGAVFKVAPNALMYYIVEYLINAGPGVAAAPLLRIVEVQTMSMPERDEKGRMSTGKTSNNCNNPVFSAL